MSVTLVGTGGPAPCRGALPDRGEVLCWSHSVGLYIYISSLSFNDGEHPAYELELYGVHDTSMTLAFLFLPHIIIFHLRVT